MVCLTETHMHKEKLEHLNIPGFQLLNYKNRKKNLKSNTAPGGIAIFVKENVAAVFTSIKTDNEDVIWTKVKKEITGTTKDIFIATCYLSPAQEKMNTNTKISKLKEEILFFATKGHVIINGDLNAWTGDASDTIQPDKYDENFCIINNEAPPNRNSKHKAINARGKELLDLCKSLELYILNGRKVGDPFGEFTSFQAKRNSVVDYLITSDVLASEISTLTVGEYIPWLSDHCSILYDLEINEDFHKPNTAHPLKQPPKQYIWSEKGIEIFLKELQKSPNKENLQNALSLDYTDPSKVVGYITNILINIADKAKIRTISKPRQDKNDPPWFDKECVDLKKEIQDLGKRRKQFPNCQATRNDLSKAKKMFKKIIKRNKSQFKNTLIQKMNWKKKDAKSFWKLLDKLDQKRGGDIFKESVSSNKWVNHFKGVFHNPNISGPLPENTKGQGSLDYSISKEEIALGAYILRQGKSPGYDQISNEMIACLLKANPEVIRKLFDEILKNPTIINKWRISMITPIHKKGAKTDPDNYRGISLMSCFAKYFLAILNNRLLKFVTDNKILSTSQLGFLPGNRTSDALLILHNLIQHYCHKNKKYIFGCFVDFSKAFDSIPRHVLFEKLLKHDILQMYCKFIYRRPSMY